MEKGLKLKVRKLLGPNPTFVEVTEEKLAEEVFLPTPSSPSWIGLRRYHLKEVYRWKYYLLIISTHFAFLFSISKWNFLEKLTMLVGVLMWCKHDWIVPPSHESLPIFPLIHKSVLLSSAFRWSFALYGLLSFWRRRLGMICIALKAISLSGELFVHPFISFIVSLIYFLAAAPVGSMNKFSFQKAIRSYASRFLDNSHKFRSPHLMFVYSSLTISPAFWRCCVSAVLWKSFAALELAGWRLSMTITSLVYVKKLCTLQDVHQK